MQTVSPHLRVPTVYIITDMIHLWAILAKLLDILGCQVATRTEMELITSKSLLISY